MAASDIATILRLASEQHGALSRDQARVAGISDDRVDRLVRTGVLEVAQRGVLRVAGSQRGWYQDMSIGVLRTGNDARVSHRAAAFVWDLDGLSAAPLEVTVPYGRRIRVAPVLVHLSSDINETRWMTRKGLPVTTVARTLVDLGSVVRPEILERALDDALRRRLTTQEELGALVERLGRHGRAGVPDLRELLAVRNAADGVTDTGFETLLLRALRDHGLPRPVTQHSLHDSSGSFVMRFDAAYPDAKVGIEADSERWHMNRQRFVDDRTKRARAAALGWRVLAFTYRHVDRDPVFVGTMVEQALRPAA